MTATCTTHVHQFPAAGQRNHVARCNIHGDLMKPTSDRETAVKVAAGHGEVGS